MDTFKKAFGIEINTFFLEVWESYCLQSNSNILDDIDIDLKKSFINWDSETISKLEVQNLHIVKESQRVLEKVYTTPNNTLEIDKLKKIWKLGYTVYIQNVDNYFLSIAKLKQKLEEQLYPLKVKINFFSTPEGQVGINPHFDSHDVFVLQTYGSKNWKIWSAIKQDVKTDVEPSEYLPKVYDYVKNNSEICSLNLLTSEALYMPRGTIHSPSAISDSNHLSFWLISPLLEDCPFTLNEENYKEIASDYYKI